MRTTTTTAYPAPPRDMSQPFELPDDDDHILEIGLRDGIAAAYESYGPLPLEFDRTGLDDDTWMRELQYREAFNRGVELFDAPAYPLPTTAAECTALGELHGWNAGRKGYPRLEERETDMLNRAYREAFNRSYDETLERMAA